MMPVCAYPDRLPSNVFCMMTMDWPLKGRKSSTQRANVESILGNRLSGWDVKCKCSLSPLNCTEWNANDHSVSVTPARQPPNSAGVFWTVQDCYGYFAYMLDQWVPLGCHDDDGFGVGNVTVGGEESLAGARFEVSFLKRS